MTSQRLNVLAISGSLRKGSFNTSLLRAAIEIAAAENVPVAMTMAELRDIPLYDEDVRSVGVPEPVQRFRDAISAADALVFATPEYNYSIPGVLKNAIDWASRPPSQPFAGKPIAIMGVSGAMSGTMRAQYHLRQVTMSLDMHAVNKPEIFVRNGKSSFDEHGRLTDDTTRKLVHQLLVALVDWTRRLRAAS
jgi:chromate reductase